jgi:hypothetical protein
MSAIEREVGVGQCPDRPQGLGHVWAGAVASGNARNPCRFCGYPGRGDARKGEHGFFQEATSARLGAFAGLKAPMESGTGSAAKAWPKEMPEQRARVAKVREDIARADRERPWQGEGQDRRRVPKP